MLRIIPLGEFMNGSCTFDASLYFFVQRLRSKAWTYKSKFFLSVFWNQIFLVMPRDAAKRRTT